MEDFACACSEYSVIPQLLWYQLSYSGLNSGISFLDEVFHFVLNSVILCLSLSYSGLNSGISFLDEVFRFAARSTFALFWRCGDAPDAYSGLSSIILCLSLSYSGLNSGILFLDEIFRFAARSTLHTSGTFFYHTQTARTVERVELLSTTGHGEILWRTNCFCDLFKRSGELASRLIYSLASGAMGGLQEHAFIDELKNGRLP
jgi:hypothetical protein